MGIPTDVKEKVLNAITEEQTVELALSLASVPGSAGFESEIADHVYDWMERLGFQPFKQFLTPQRPNVIGRIAGRNPGRGRSLMFNSHMDVAEGSPRDLWGPPFGKGERRGERLYGKAILNDRGPMAAFLAAAKAITDAGVRLNGDLWLAAVVGEIDQAPIDEFQGPEFLGNGIGTFLAVTQGVVPDFGIIAETTDFGVTWIECGMCFFKVTVEGETVYGSRHQRPEDPLDYNAHPNALVKMMPVVNAIEQRGREYSKKYQWRSRSGDIVVTPNVTLGALRAGLPHRPSLTANKAMLYIDVRLTPGQSPRAVERELREVVDATGIKGVSVECFWYRPGYEGEGTEPLVDAISKAYTSLTNQPLPPVNPHETSMWRDLNVLNGLGIPAVTYGPRRIADENGVKYMPVNDLVLAAKVYALVALDICGVAE